MNVALGVETDDGLNRWPSVGEGVKRFSTFQACPVAGKTLLRIMYRWVVNESRRITHARCLITIDTRRGAYILHAIFIELFLNKLEILD